MYRYNNYFDEFKRLIVFKIEKKKKRVKTFVFIGMMKIWYEERASGVFSFW